MGVLSLPEVVQVVEAEEDREALRALLLETLEGALDEAAAMRAVEGEALQRDLNARADALEKIARAIAARAPQTLIAYRERLRANVCLLYTSVSTSETSSPLAAFTANSTAR